MEWNEIRKNLIFYRWLGLFFFLIFALDCVVIHGYVRDDLYATVAKVKKHNIKITKNMNDISSSMKKISLLMNKMHKDDNTCFVTCDIEKKEDF